MTYTNLHDDLVYGDAKSTVKLVLETPFSKEIRITFKEGQLMKEHKTPFPIVVEVVDGEIDFGINGETHSISKGALLILEGGVPHDLLAKNDSIVRLTLSKFDAVERVQ
ncbi:MAG: quercetin dioxygenase-like cupin family protein [Spirosomataceae bacterium]|jgi:quercetin dioxygenase-like cupin family protein